MRIGEATNVEELVQACEEARQRRLQLRRGHETTWWQNIAMVAGDHYAKWNPDLAQFTDQDSNTADLGDKKPRLVLNHTLTVARTEHAKLTKSRVVMSVMANSDEQVDLAATKVSNSVIDALEWKFRLRAHRKSILWNMIQMGVCASFVGWDYLNDKAGSFKFKLDPQTKEPVFDPDRIRELEKMVEEGDLEGIKEEEYPLGELEYKIYNAMQLLPDETALEWEKINDLITSEVVDIDVVKGLYGARDTKDLRPEDVNLGTMERRMLHRAGLTPGKNFGVANGLALHTYWLLPNFYRGNKFLKDGCMLRWAQGHQVLEHARVFPFADKRMPFAFYKHIPSTTSIWPDDTIRHIRGANLEIDKTVSQLIENKDFMANPMWLIATQHKIKGEVKNVAGAIVRYVHVPNVPPPQPVQGLQMPTQVENIVAGLRDQILDISGQSEVARGRVPSGVRSGVAVAYLQEEDDSKIAPTVENMEEAVAYETSLSLSRVGQFYSTKRILGYYRRDGIFDVVKFKGSDLRGNTDVVAQSQSAMPKSKAARQQYALQLIELGVLRDPRKIEQVLELGFGEPDDLDKAIAQADRENNAMLTGMKRGLTEVDVDLMSDEEKEEEKPVAIPVKTWHNHQVHMQRHTSVMMDEEFDRLAVTNPEVVRLFDEHMAMHQGELEKQQQAQMAMLLAAKGAPDGPPGSSPESSGPQSPEQAAMAQMGANGGAPQ